jgi:hypothetical protein
MAAMGQKGNFLCEKASFQRTHHLLESRENVCHHLHTEEIVLYTSCQELATQECCSRKYIQPANQARKRILRDVCVR